VVRVEGASVLSLDGASTAQHRRIDTRLPSHPWVCCDGGCREKKKRNRLHVEEVEAAQ